jgi:hypothetical protein
MAAVEENPKGRQVKRAPPNTGDGLVAIIPHDVAFAGVESVSVEEVDDALEQVEEAYGGEEKAERKQYGAEAVSGEVCVVTGQ